MRCSPAALRLAALKNAVSAPLTAHQRLALTCRSYAELLTAGDLWFLDAVLKLKSLNDRQQARLNEVAMKIERGRRK